MTAGLARAAEVLAVGGIVCFPTESSYGLAARIDRPDALAALSRLKQRAEGSPFGLVAAGLEQARAVASAFPERAAELARAHWPGPLTLVVPAREGLPRELVLHGAVGVRVPGLAVARELARLAGVAITATSANPRGEPAALSVAQAQAYFGETVQGYVDGGIAQDVPPSTLAAVDIDGRVRVLRRGAIVIQECLP